MSRDGIDVGNIVVITVAECGVLVRDHIVVVNVKIVMRIGVLLLEGTVSGQARFG